MIQPPGDKLNLKMDYLLGCDSLDQQYFNTEPCPNAMDGKKILKGPELYLVIRLNDRARNFKMEPVILRV